MIELFALILVAIVALAAIAANHYNIKQVSESLEKAYDKTTNQINELIEANSNLVGIQQVRNISIEDAQKMQEEALNSTPKKLYYTEEEEEQMFSDGLSIYETDVEEDDSGLQGEFLAALGQEIRNQEQ